MWNNGNSESVPFVSLSQNAPYPSTCSKQDEIKTNIIAENNGNRTLTSKKATAVNLFQCKLWTNKHSSMAPGLLFSTLYPDTCRAQSFLEWANCWQGSANNATYWLAFMSAMTIVLTNSEEQHSCATHVYNKDPTILNYLCFFFLILAVSFNIDTNS